MIIGISYSIKEENRRENLSGEGYGYKTVGFCEIIYTYIGYRMKQIIQLTVRGDENEMKRKNVLLHMIFLLFLFVFAIFMSTVAFAADENSIAVSTTTTARSNSSDVAVIVTGKGETETIVGYYPLLKDAIDAVTENCTIRLIDDTTEDVTFNYSTSRTVVLDLNGYTLNGNITNTRAVLEIRDYSGEQYGRITGNITNTDAQYSTKASTTRIYGGHIGGTLTKGKNTKLYANAGFYKQNPVAFIQAGYIVNNISDNHGCDYQVVEDQVAKIIRNGQEITYRTLSLARSDVQEGETIIILKDISGNASYDIGKSITIDLNGHKVEGTQDSYVFKINKYNATIDVTIRNGSIVHSPSGKVRYGAVYAEQGGNLILEDVKITGKPDSDGNSYGLRIGNGTGSISPKVVIRGKYTIINALTAGVAVIGKTDAGTASVTVENGTITGSYYGIAGNGINDNTDIKVFGGQISGGDTAIYHPQDGDLTITGGSLTGKQGVQYIGAGKLTISGGSITATADAMNGEPVISEGDGSISDGAAVSVISRGGEYGAAGGAEVSITGGSIISTNNVAIREYGAIGMQSLVKMMTITQSEGKKLIVTGGDEGKTAVKLDILSGDKAKVISGGVFSSKVPVEYCTAEFQPTNQRSDGTYTVENKIDGHNYNESTWQYNRTNHYHLCTICEKEKSDVAEHAYGNWTETDEGEKVHTCTVCGYRETKAISKPEHVHAYGTEWKSDRTKHWHECSCGAKDNVTVHSFRRVIDKNATATETGSRYEECTVCGYKKEAVTIPATGTDKPNADSVDSAQTGDNINLRLWISLMLISIIGLTGSLFAFRRKGNCK